MDYRYDAEPQYLQAMKIILETGYLKQNRTGVSAYTVPHMMVQHDMSMGFPLMTTKRVPFKSVAVELEGFIKGMTDKHWYQDRGCTIWDEWCNPKAIPETITDKAERKAYAKLHHDLGPIYGAQWRNFNGANKQEADQLRKVVDTLETDKSDRRMLCSAWNPLVADQQALPPCHVLWHVTVINNKLNLCWFQRSCDWFLGVPFNIASYALLLHLLAKQAKLEEGILTGFFSDAHVYENHVEAVKTQLARDCRQLPTIQTDNFHSIYHWEATKTTAIGYNPHPRIKAEVAV